MRKQATVLFILVSISIFGQSFSKKYITYRSRFREDFLTKIDNPHEKGNFVPIENITTSGQLIFADETWYLGLYLAVLASEYKLHKFDNNIKGANESLTEINNILITIDRLDSVAETYWGKPSKLNGFFIREDYTKRHEPMSQDQVWNLFYGFRMIKLFVDDSLTVNRTKEITTRILYGIYPIVKEKRNGKVKRKWCIVNPNKEIVQKKIELSVTKFAFAQTATFITDTNMFFKGSKNFWTRFLFSVSRAPVYHNLLMKKYTHMYNTYGITSLTVLASPKKGFEYSLKIDKLINKYFPEGALSHLPITAALLYNKQLPHTKEYYTKILDLAPMEGVNYKTKAPWNSLNLLACPWQVNSNGRFNGLDYLLLHNLVEVYFNDKQD